MIEFSSETIWSWAFVFGEIFDHSFNFSACNWVVIISISSCSILEDWTFLRICPFLPSYPFYCHGVVHNSLIILCISSLSVVTSPFSFLILLIWFFSLFFLMSLAKDLSILFIFSKNQLLVLLVFTIISFISFPFISARIFMISFLLLIWGIFCSYYSNCRCKVRLSIWCFSCFLR